MPIRAAINGFGRTGRAAFRAAVESGADIEWVAVNDVVDAADPRPAAQVRHGLRPFRGSVDAVEGGIVVDGVHVRTPMERDPAALPWGELDVDVVIESSGRFRARADAEKHLRAGAKKVIVSAPAKEPDITVALGVNFEQYDPDVHHIISNASCTTNCLAPVAKVLHETRRHPARADDDRARVHLRPVAARRPAQGSPPCTGGGGQPRAHLHRRREGARPRPAGARRQAPRVRRSRPGADRVARRPDRRGGARHDGRRGERAVRVRGRTRESCAASSGTARSRSSRPTSSARPTRRSSTRRSRP